VCAIGDPANSGELAEAVRAFRQVVRSTEIETFSQTALALRQWMIANDPHRPMYHFTGPEGWINDPNGPIYHQGTYHLFYQYDPMVADGKGGWRRSARCWGHAVSKDLVHWVDWPVALWPDTPHDRAGVYSGNTFIDEEGRPCALYTGNVAGHRETYGILARSTDGWVTWQKKMVMPNSQRPNADSPVHWDGYIWKEPDRWCQLIGGTTGGKGRRGAAYLWTSPDLEHWTLAKPIYTGGPGEFWELPYLVPFGAKCVLMLGVGGNPYVLGRYDRKSMTFTPDTPEEPVWRSVDRGDYYCVNPNMVDEKGPGGSARRILHGWVTNKPSPTKAVPYWQGIHSLPRVITLRGDRLWQEPIPELQALRGRKQSFRNLLVTPEFKGFEKAVAGDALEIIATFAGGDARRFGLTLRASADGKTGIPVWFDRQNGRFGAADKNAASEADPGESVRMHVFLDRSVVEVFVNGNVVTKVAYLDPAARGVRAFAEGGNCTLESLEVWPMKTMWKNRPSK